MSISRPNQAEINFLTLACNRFYDHFWQKYKFYRFCKIKDGFAVYSELLNYEPIKSVLNWMKNGGRPPKEGGVGDELFRFVRNIILHFPFFKQPFKFFHTLTVIVNLLKIQF